MVGAAIEASASETITGIMTGVEAGDSNEAVKSAALSASEGCKMGAIGGGATGALSHMAQVGLSQRPHAEPGSNDPKGIETPS